MRMAKPPTTSSDSAVNTSRTPVAATNAKMRRRQNRPMTNTPATTATITGVEAPPPLPSLAAPAIPNNGISAIIGTTAMS